MRKKLMVQNGIITWRLGYDKSKEKAKDIYARLGHIKCPALGDKEVAFSRIGFNHLIRKGRVLRTRSEQKRRFVLIEYIKQIILDPNATILFRESSIKEKVVRGNKRVFIKSHARFWTFVSNIKDCKIKVVIRQMDEGKLQFLSIFGDNVITRIKKSLKT